MGISMMNDATLMTSDLFQAWALKQLEEHMRRNMPGARAVRQLKADLSQSRKDMARARRSLAASHAASQRKLNHHLAEAERASREAREASDRKFEEKRWALIMDSQ